MSNVHLIQIFMLLIKFLNTKLWLKMIVKKKKWVYYATGVQMEELIIFNSVSNLHRKI